MVDTLNFFKGKKVFITGDTGFKGSWLSFWLNRLGAEVVGYALPPERSKDHFNLLKLESKIDHIDGNILDFEFLKKKINDIKPEIIFHLAAQALVRRSYTETKLTFDTNVSGSVNLLEIIKNCDSIRSVIYVTSDKCYENKEWLHAYRENDILGGHDPYSASKAAAEIVFKSFMDSFFSVKDTIGLASVRSGNVIGGGDWSMDRIVPDSIMAFSKNQPLEIRSPTATRPWQHVLEPLWGYMLLASKLYQNPKEYSKAWNFGPDIDSIVSVQKLVNLIAGYFDKPVIKTKTENKLHEATCLHLNCDKAKLKLNWQPVWGLGETIHRTSKWYLGFIENKNPEGLTKSDIDSFTSELISKSNQVKLM